MSMGTAPSRPRNLQLIMPRPLFSICIRVTSCTGAGHVRLLWSTVVCLLICEAPTSGGEGKCATSWWS